ncbi:Transposable element Tc1 transposase [Anabarilius grahami]|uniref:Transposable element Tc1 transposase n=1 Tax=Anabarilius grahami TaxID=495550 RepID=A0A3N0Z170_ANAGA|nr:Transposable element Tc1 transposase [Anabarilius grahami]
MPQMSQVLRERAIGMLTAGLSTRAVARELNVHFSTISRLQRRFREFGSTSNRPHNRSVTTPAQDLHIQHLWRPATRTAAAAFVCRRNRLECANAHIRWHLALWRGVLFTDESRFSLYRADGRQCVWRCVGERFADVNIVDRVAHGGGGVMVWAGVCYGQRTQVRFIDGILNAQRYRDEILRPIVVPFIHDHHLMLQHDNARP